MADRSGPAEGVEGVVEDVKGRFKQAAGALTGDDSTVREGEAQQDKAAAQREAAEKEAEAERSRAAADRHEARERSHQDR